MDEVDYNDDPFYMEDTETYSCSDSSEEWDVDMDSYMDSSIQ